MKEGLTKHKKCDTMEASGESRVGFLLRKHRSKVRFLLVGGTNFVIDLAIFTFLANVMAVPAVVASLISTMICIVISFFLNYHFVWQSSKSKLGTAPRFFGVSLFSAWVVQSSVIWLVTSTFSFAFDESFVNLVAKVAGIGVATVINYFGYRFIFR